MEQVGPLRAGPVPAQMWQRRARSRCRCGSGEPGPDADVGRGGPHPGGRCAGGSLAACAMTRSSRRALCRSRGRTCARTCARAAQRRRWAACIWPDRNFGKRKETSPAAAPGAIALEAKQTAAESVSVGAPPIDLGRCSRRASTRTPSSSRTTWCAQPPDCLPAAVCMARASAHTTHITRTRANARRCTLYTRTRAHTLKRTRTRASGVLAGLPHAIRGNGVPPRRRPNHMVCTAQHSTAQHRTAQHRTAQRRTLPCPALHLS
jgi:hypothetical protein